jgi:hypothetical protein
LEQFSSPKVAGRSAQTLDGISFHYFPKKFKFSLNNSLLPVDVLISVECKAWARNIEHDRDEKIGTVNFELMIEKSRA